MNIATVAVLSSTNRQVRTVHAELAFEMIRRGEAQAACRGGRVRAIRLVWSLVGKMVGPCSKLTAHSYGCSRYVRRETINLQEGVSTIYSFKSIDPEEQGLTFCGAKEAS